MGEGKSKVFTGCDQGKVAVICLDVQMDFYISSWEKTQLLSIKAEVCATHDSLGRSPELDQGMPAMRVGRKVGIRCWHMALNFHPGPPLWGLRLGNRLLYL